MDLPYTTSELEWLINSLTWKAWNYGLEGKMEDMNYILREIKELENQLYILKVGRGDRCEQTEANV